jgi:phage protein D
MGYHGQDLKLMIKGQITSLRPSFPSAGQPTLAISGLNVIHKFRKKEETWAYTSKTDSEIAIEVGDRLGIKVNTDRAAKEKETKYDYVFQDNQYDIIFLMDRARRAGYDLWVTEKTVNGKTESELNFGQSNNIKEAVTYQLSFAKYRLNAGQSPDQRNDQIKKLFPLIDFKPELSTAQQVSEVTVKGWNPKTKTAISQTATREEIRTKGVGAKGGQAAIEKSFSECKEIITDKPVSTDDEAKKLALASLDMIAKEMVKGNGATIGLPDLRAGGVVKMDGMGDRFSGRYFVTATTHSIGDGGYTTNFECRREEVTA